MEEKKKSNFTKIIVGIIIVVLIAIILVLLVNQNKNNDSVSTKKRDTKKDDISNTISNTEENTNSVITDTSSSAQKDNTKEKYAEVSVGQTVTVEDYLEYSFVETKFTSKIEPSVPDSYYHYYEAKSSDNILMAVKTKIKNLEVEEFSGDQLPKATVIYDGKYKYNCTLIVEEDDGSDLDGYDWYMDIEPLKSKTFYYYAELPLEAQNDGKSLVLRIDLKDNSYELNIR